MADAILNNNDRNAELSFAYLAALAAGPAIPANAALNPT